MRTRSPRYLFLTPPLVQTNTPYPATMHLVGFLRQQGIVAEQRDLSIAVVRDVLTEYGGEEVEEILELLGGEAPVEDKLDAAAWIEELARSIQENVDESFGFSRYAARICSYLQSFSDLAPLIRRRGVIDGPLERRLEEAIRETRPTVIGVTCPFPGTVVAAFKIARYVKRHYPQIKMVLGGGFVSTEMREMTTKAPARYFDEICFDEGYPYFSTAPIPAFVAPSYDGIDWSLYFDLPETVNPMHRLWSTGRWMKLQMARGCYWHKCAFCDVKLPYINCFEMPKAAEIVDAMERLIAESHGHRGFHFTDEAMPPALVQGMCEEILRRGLTVRWWGNIRFDGAWTPELCALAARAGCIAVTGGLECANDRLLALMNKGITCRSAREVLGHFRAVGILVHAYLMYGFPTETADEAFGALGYVRRLFREKLIASAFWHRFALTIHSPIAREPEKFGIRLIRLPKQGAQFCRNEIPYREKGAPNWSKIGRILDIALSNYLEGRGLSKPISFWREALEGRKGACT